MASYFRSDVVTLSKYLDQHMGEQIAVLCHSRGKDIRHLKPNWYESSIWQPDPEKRGKFAIVRVMIAKKDLDAFKAIPTAGSSDGIILQIGSRHVKQVPGPAHGRTNSSAMPFPRQRHSSP